MVAPAIPLVYWGYAILFAGGATIAAYPKGRPEDLEPGIGKVELPGSIQRLFEPQAEPDLEPDNRQPQRPNNTALRAAMTAMIATEAQIKRRCDDNEQQDCHYCKPAVEGRSTWDNFDGGPISKPYPKARGSLYQHYVVPWFQYITQDMVGYLYIQLEEWSWRRSGNWDGLDHTACKLYECKLGYRDFLDENRLDDDESYKIENPSKFWLGSLENAFEGTKKQFTKQYETFVGEWPEVTLEWVFSDEEVMWQFVKMRGDYGYNEIDNKHIPAPFAPSGTQFVGELYASGEEDYGYWEDT